MKNCHSNRDSCNSNSCHDQEESCHKEEEQDAFTHCLLEAADCAWMEVLKDKIKEHILATQNERMKELAKLVAEENNQRWKLKMETKNACKGFKEKLCRFFGHSK